MKKTLKKLFLCIMVFCLFMQMNMVETQAATKVGNTKITSITQTGKKSVKVAFKKVSGAKGYTLQYRTACGSWKTKNVTKNKLTISKLSTGKTYQFRVRAYKNVNGKKKYGKYSGVKKITVRDYVYLVDTYEPYNSSYYEAYTNGNSFKMGGKEQKKSFVLGLDGVGIEKFANFNIDRKYNKLSFKVGKVDGASNHPYDGDLDVKIYSDGKLVKTVSVGIYDLPKTVNVSLKNTSRLTFEVEENACTLVGFSDVKLYYR